MKFMNIVCCRNLKDTKILMKTGLGLVLAGHVNFLLGALVHGAVLRNVSVSVQAATMEYAIANIIALTAGLTAAIGGISAIVLSKNMKNKSLKWLLLVMSLLACLLGCASAVSVFASMVTAISNSGLSLLTQCNLNGTVNTYSITYECPFDPTRIYGTTLTLWVLVIIMSLVEVAFSGRCFVACTAFLRLPCPWRKMPVNANRVRFRTTEDCNQAASSYAPDVEEPTEENDLLNTTTPTEETSEL
ncbi:transmembrane protein 54a [Electrophorus electricus]|uniref:Transmembrane protein 54a n=1 Tax=Electrophorus electricus TaxID=8005 RepID=A0A4W4HMX5_ELEEL|nr:transmembrane protein 54a [Electrophorus electricus]XP_026864138.1 transmembrane protein 54a [Electrophorus electricus]